MVKEERTTKFENELNTLLGLGNDNKETLLNYVEYVTLGKDQVINDIGNYNVFLSIKDGFNYTKQVIDLIFQVLKENGITDDETYYIVTRNDLRRNLIKSDVNVLLINEDTGIFLRSSQTILKQFIYDNSDKILILLDKFQDKNFLDKRLENYLAELFSFNLCIDGKLDKQEKQIYIQNKLKANNIKVSSRCNLVKILAKNDTTVIDKELLYLTVKCRANHTDTITDKFLEQIHRTQYITNKRNNGKSAMQELDELIGLEDIKKQIKQIINYVRINKERGQLPMLHMAFLGPAGCGKTEVAKLVARIFQEEGILQNDMVEATRENLIGAYIGHTAIKTKETINKALGGTLFIDERLLSYTKFRKRLWK